MKLWKWMSIGLVAVGIGAGVGVYYYTQGLPGTEEPEHIRAEAAPAVVDQATRTKLQEFHKQPTKRARAHEHDVEQPDMESEAHTTTDKVTTTDQTDSAHRNVRKAAGSMLARYRSFQERREQLSTMLEKAVTSDDMSSTQQIAYQNLETAISLNNLEAVIALIESGADVSARLGRHDETPLHKAAAAGYTEVAKALLMVGAEVNSRDNDGDTPLHGAALTSAESVTVLLEAGANVNARNNDGETPLHKAVDGGNEEITSLLIAAGAEVDIQDELGDSALHIAAQEGEIEIVRQLLRAQVNVDARNRDGETPLHNAAIRGEEKTAFLLITAGAGLNIKDNVGDTPLHQAAEDGEEEIVRVLLNAQADVNARNNDGKTPFDLARENNHEGILRLLESHSIEH